jgi:SpoVK/Ycf46/Vps4 family AAA+-type ATPase
VQNLAIQYQQQNPGKKVAVDHKAFDMLVQNLQGLAQTDARRLAHNVIFHDGAITHSDIPEITKAKYQLLGQDSALSFEYDTSKFSDVGGMSKLKAWLQQRQAAFTTRDSIPGLDPPKGILLLGVQGCGKSLAAKAVAGLWGLPLLRLDFGTLFDKYYGETERNLREALKTAEVMAPCVLWIDELEKSIAPGDVDSGPSRRVLATLLTWMSEKNSQIFLVATANDIKQLPPELVRKGRFDEIFFVDLPRPDVRKTILSIHLNNRKQDLATFNLDKLAEVSEGFSGAELEQAVVSALYASHAAGEKLSDVHILEEISKTRPLSVVMAERIGELRSWARDRTVPSD